MCNSIIEDLGVSALYKTPGVQAIQAGTISQGATLATFEGVTWSFIRQQLKEKMYLKVQ